MKKALRDLRAGYMSAIKGYIGGRGEAALEQAYELGRDAVDARLGVLDIAAAHEAALDVLLAGATTLCDSARVTKTAEVFLAEALAPYEMTQRGFQEANAELRELNMTLECRVRERTEELTATLARLRHALDGAIQTIGLIGEIRDPYTAGHEERVSGLAVAIAREMKLGEEQVEGVRVAALLHDVGKIAIPTEILSKPGRITSYELRIIKEHSQVGYDILKVIDFPWPVADIVLQSHERIDGSGYPSGLNGDRIMVEARILAVADVVEAMASHRPYRPALGVKAALKELEAGRGRLYDPEAVNICLNLFRKKRFRFKETRQAA